jgi:hypothetical protein
MATPHATARIEHEKFIGRVKSEIHDLESAKQNEATAEAKIDSEISKLALKASGGDKGALKSQRELHDRKSEHHIQQDNLEALASPLRAQLADAELELPRFFLREAIEAALNAGIALEPVAQKFSDSLDPAIAAFGAYKSQFDAVVVPALRLINADGSAKVLAERARTVLDRGLRNELALKFRDHGFRIVDLTGDEAGFAETVRLFLGDLSKLLEVRISEGREASGRTLYRATTKVSGFYGRDIALGEIISLPSGDPNAAKMLALGAFEIVHDSDMPQEASSKAGA